MLEVRTHDKLNWPKKDYLCRCDRCEAVASGINPSLAGRDLAKTSVPEGSVACSALCRLLGTFCTAGALLRRGLDC